MSVPAGRDSTGELCSWDIALPRTSDHVGAAESCSFVVRRVRRGGRIHASKERCITFCVLIRLLWHGILDISQISKKLDGGQLPRSLP